MNALIWLLSPIARYAAFGLLIIALAGGIYLKIQNDAVSAERARIEQEKTDAINKAREARDNLRAACDRDPAACVPDNQYRD